MYKWEIDSQTTENNFLITKEKAQRRDKLGVWYYHIHIYTTVAENNLMVTKGEKGGEGIN